MPTPLRNVVTSGSDAVELTVMSPAPSAPSTMPDCSDQKMRLSGALIARGAACGSTGAFRERFALAATGGRREILARRKPIDQFGVRSLCAFMARCQRL